MLRGLLVPGRCAEICHHHGLVGTSTAGADNRTSGLPHKTHRPGGHRVSCHHFVTTTPSDPSRLDPIGAGAHTFRLWQSRMLRQ